MHAKRLLLAGFALCALAISQAPSAIAAYTLWITEDNNEFVTITTDSPQYAASGGLIASGPEFGRVYGFSLDAAVPLLQTGTFLEGLIEAPGENDPTEQPQTLSDALLIFETLGSATVGFIFASDPFDPAFTAGAAEFSQIELIGPNVMTPISGNTGTILIQPIITSEVPEPTTLALIGAGLAGAGAMRRRKKKSA